MVIVKVAGGIGNQLFQYVFGQYLRYRYHLEVEYDCNYLTSVDDSRNRELDALVTDIRYNHTLSISKYRGLRAHLSRLWYKLHPKLHYITQKDAIPEVYKPGHVYFFKGYWQSIKYYDWLRQNVKDFAIESCEIPCELRALYDEIKASENTLSLHVRRGDYFSPKFIKTYGVCGPSYYQRALEQFEQLHPYPVKIYVFTDDPDWVRQHLPLSDNMTLIPNFPISQFAYIELMSLCRHHILSNSSFSWWGTVLNHQHDAHVLCPKVWLLNSDWTIALKDWIKVEVGD